MPNPHRPRVVRPRRLPSLALAALLLAARGPGATAAAQDAPPSPDTVARPAPVSPGGALLRALLVPGWGHASIGSYGRAGFYFLTEGTAIFGVVKSRLRLGDARRRVRGREDFLTELAVDQGITDPADVQALLDDDDVLDDLRSLRSARKEQQEDWLALGIALALLSVADAFVTAHLMDFPEPLDVNVQPAGEGRVEVSVRLPFGSGPARAFHSRSSGGSPPASTR